MYVVIFIKYLVLKIKTSITKSLSKEFLQSSYPDV